MVNTVVPHDPEWAVLFAAEAQQIASAMGDTRIRLHHIGSTAIANILAKPIIDLLGVVEDIDNLDARSDRLQSLGYEAMGAFGITGRRYFRKANAHGQRTHHLHVFARGSHHIERHIAFRDYLRAHPAVAAEYSAIKSSLIQGTNPSWDAYLDGKDPFIKATEADAVLWYRCHPQP